MEISYAVDPDITKASTIDARFYHDAAAYALSSERIFARTWQWIGNLGDVATHGALSARELLPGLLNEPLLLARDKLGALRCLSNVCTRRGNLLVKAPYIAAHVRVFTVMGDIRRRVKPARITFIDCCANLCVGLNKY